jgi:hypothetical protein
MYSKVFVGLKCCAHMQWLTCFSKKLQMLKIGQILITKNISFVTKTKCESLVFDFFETNAGM